VARPAQIKHRVRLHEDTQSHASVERRYHTRTQRRTEARFYQTAPKLRKSPARIWGWGPLARTHGVESVSKQAELLQSTRDAGQSGELEMLTERESLTASLESVTRARTLSRVSGSGSSATAKVPSKLARLSSEQSQEARTSTTPRMGPTIAVSCSFSVALLTVQVSESPKLEPGLAPTRVPRWRCLAFVSPVLLTTVRITLGMSDTTDFRRG
jgi:hypothetical protein